MKINCFKIYMWCTLQILVARLPMGNKGRKLRTSIQPTTHKTGKFTFLNLRDRRYSEKLV